MIAEKDEIIKKRYQTVSIFLPVVCVLLNFLGLLMSGFESFWSVIPQLSFTACFAFIFVFYIDLKRNVLLDHPYKMILIIAGIGITFVSPSFMDNFGITLIIVLAVSLFCAFLCFDFALILMVGYFIYVWAFEPNLLITETIIYCAAVLMVCLIIAFSDKISKLVYSLIIFTVFYTILNLVFNNIDLQKAFNMTVFTVWLFCLAVIICLFFVKNIIDDNVSAFEGVLVPLGHYGRNADKGEKKDNGDSSGSDQGTVATEYQQFDEYSGADEHPGKDMVVDTETTAGTDISEGTETAAGIDISAGTKTADGSDIDEGRDTGAGMDIATGTETAAGIDISNETETASEMNVSTYTEKAAGTERNNEITDETSSYCEKSQDGEQDQRSDTSNNNDGGVSHQSNQALFESIQELSARLVKLESENSVLQLMLNSSVYDLQTIVDPDYPYILKLKEESAKYYNHCLKVAKISAEAAALISCDSEEAYAIGMYIKAPRILGDGASSVLAGTYKIPRNIISAVNKINNKINASVMTREAGIVMLTDDILNTINYLKAKNSQEVSIERIVNNTIKVRKEQNYLRSAGFTNEEIQLLRLYYNDLKEHFGGLDDNID